MYLKPLTGNDLDCKFCNSDTKLLYKTSEKDIDCICKNCIGKFLPVNATKISENDIEKITEIIKHIVAHNRRVRRNYTSTHEIKAFLLWRLEVKNIPTIEKIKQDGITKKAVIQVTFTDGYLLELDSNKLYFLLLIYLGTKPKNNLM